MIAARQDPRHAERAEREATFAVAMETYLRTHVAGQRKAAVVEREMRRELLPRFGSRPLTAITRRDAIRLIDEIKARAPHQARNVRAFTQLAIQSGERRERVNTPRQIPQATYRAAILRWPVARPDGEVGQLLPHHRRSRSASLRSQPLA